MASYVRDANGSRGCTLHLAGDAPFAELDLQGFRSFIRRSVFLEAMQLHHTGVHSSSSSCMHRKTLQLRHLL